MKKYTLLQHPDAESFNRILFCAICDEACKCGHEVRLQRISLLKYKNQANLNYTIEKIKKIAHT